MIEGKLVYASFHIPLFFKITRHSGTLRDQKINEYIFKNPFSVLTRLRLFYLSTTRWPNQCCFTLLKQPCQADAAVLPAGIDRVSSLPAGCASRQKQTDLDLSEVVWHVLILRNILYKVSSLLLLFICIFGNTSSCVSKTWPL